MMGCKKHSPTLETIKMVEETIKSNNGKYAKTKLWEELPKKVMYQTYKTILDYLMESNQVVMNSHKVTWIYDQDLFDKLRAQTVETKIHDIK